MQASLRYTLEDQRLMSAAKNYFAWQSRLAMREVGQKVIEIGCGVGNFTGMLLDRELVVAVDREAACIEQLKERYPGRANLRAMVGDIGDGRLDVGEGFDTCVCLNVLEHVEDDICALRAMRDLLAPGGAVILIVPAFAALYGPIDQELGHRRRYGRGDLERVARGAGLRVVKIHYMNLAGLFGWWWNARIAKRTVQSAAQIAFFDRWVVPAMARLEERVKPPFGQSLFAVMKKDATVTR